MPSKRQLARFTAHRIPEQPEERRWLIEGLWRESAVGVIGGEPKSYKTFLALDMAVAVASGRPCLRQYAVPNPGPVLLYAAEDSLQDVRQRLQGICLAAGVAFESLPIEVIAESQLRLDLPEDCEALEDAIVAVKPRLLILDPFVRLHGPLDENSSGAVAPLLGFLRGLQRTHDASVAVVHHARKAAGARREGQALRGSSDFHAWGDSNLYLRRDGARLFLTIEHRSAPSRAGIPLAVRTHGGAVSLAHVETGAEITEEGTEPVAHRTAVPLPPMPKDPEEAVLEALRGLGPLNLAELRQVLRMRHAAIRESLAKLVREGALEPHDGRYHLAEPGRSGRRSRSRARAP